MSARVFPIADLSAILSSRSRSNEEVTSRSTSANTTSASPSSPINETKHICSRFLKKRPPDMYGQRHAIESSKCISDSLRLLEREICNLPDEKKSGIEQARVLCPEIFEAKEHRLLFLRCEQFNVDLAALRMANYWIRRIELFGSKAFTPFSITDMKEKDGHELSMGFLRLIPETDGTGRCNIFIDPSVLEDTEYNDESMVRAAWYTLHAALEYESTQQKGIVFLVYLRNTYVRHFDRSLVSLLANSIRGTLPVRVSAIHIFHAPYLFEVLFDVVSLLLGERLTKRMKMYSGEDEAIHDQLFDFGILPSRLPVELGGSLEFEQDRWIIERESEGK